MNTSNNEKENKYQVLFEDSPISLWEEDFSEVKSYIDNLIDNGIKDLKTYLDEHPEEVRKIVTLVNIVDINNATLSMYGAKDKKDFFDGLTTFFREESFEDFKEEIVTFANGETVFEKEVINYKLTGEKMNILLKSTIVPGCEETFSRILVSIIDITDKKKVEQELQMEKELKELLLDNLPCSAFILSNKTKRIISANKSARERGAVVGELCYEALTPGSEPCPWCLSSDVCESGKEKRLEVEVQNRIWDIYWIPIDEDLLIHFAFDITSKKKMDESIKASEIKFRELFQKTPIPLRELDFSEALNYINQLKISGINDLREYFELSPTEVVKIASMVKDVRMNDAMLELYGVDSLEQYVKIRMDTWGERTKEENSAIAEYYLELLEGKTIIEAPVVNIIKGKKNYSLSRSIVIPGHEETLSQVLVANVDITKIKMTEKKLQQMLNDRIQIEAELQQSEERLEHALKGGGLGIWDRDVKTGEIVRDERTAQIYGYPLEEIESNVHWWEERIHPEDKSEVLSNLGQCISGKSTFFEAEYRFKLPSDEWRWILSRGKAVEHDDNGRALRITGTALDITDKKTAEKLKEELENRRENFIWMTSHELRTPLTIVSGYIELLERDMEHIDLNKQQTIFSVIRRNLKRFENLIDRVSSVIQLEQDLFDIDLKEIDVCEFLETIVESYKHMLEDQLQFNNTSTMNPLLINGDRNRLQQVLENIVGNAIKQTSPDNNEIIITLKDFTKTIQIEIRDNGAGIAKENIERIFEQFISIHTDYSVTGTGLGLFISRRILEAHGGSIIAQSKGVGKGSTFIIDLPRIINKNLLY